MIARPCVGWRAAHGVVVLRALPAAGLRRAAVWREAPGSVGAVGWEWERRAGAFVANVTIPCGTELAARSCSVGLRHDAA
jgi:hypothetical protein